MKENQLAHVLFVIIGPSGSGKTRVTEAVFPKEYKVISHTTRKIREEETEGVDYFFETMTDFQQLISSHALAEYDTYNGNFYGVGVQSIKEKTAQHVAYNALTIEGFIAVKQIFGEKVIPIFFDVSKERVAERLEQRETDNKQIQERLTLYENEIKVKEKIQSYPRHIIIDANQPFEQVVAEVSEKILPYL